MASAKRKGPCERCGKKAPLVLTEWGDVRRWLCSPCELARLHLSEKVRDGMRRRLA